MSDARKPPYPRSPHTCPRCGAWSPDPWAWKQPHHCQTDGSAQRDEPSTHSTDTFTSCEPCNEFYSWLSRDTPPGIEEFVTRDDAIAWAQERGIYSDDEDERAAAVGFLARLGLFSGEEGGDADPHDQA